MGNTFGFLHVQSEGGFQFTVIDACKAAHIDMKQTCSLIFNSTHELFSIGNVTRGNFEAKPGIAGIGIWLAMILFFGVVVIALAFVVMEVVNRTSYVDSGIFSYFKDTPVSDAGHSGLGGQKEKGLFRRAGRTFVLGVSDTQTIFVGAFLLNFAGQSKCQLTSYHFTVAVNQMMIALSAITFSVALIRSYWRYPLAAGFRTVLSLCSFTGVGLTIFRKANYAPDWPPPDSRKDSAILLPVACLLETSLRDGAEAEAKKSQADLGFGNSSTWPVERFFFIALSIAFIFANAAIPFRFARRRNYTPRNLARYVGFSTLAYWPIILVPPTFTSVWCWIRVYQAREWVNNSGWIASPNPEMVIWDQGQLTAMGILLTILLNLLTESMKRESKAAQNQRAGFIMMSGEEGSRSILMDTRRPPLHREQQRYEPYRSS